PDLSSGELTLPYERYGIDQLEEAVRRLRTGEAIGKVVLDLG
ncbi:zinc-binding dehydrogenase, partial [Streptomyces sp. NPDC056121]